MPLPHKKELEALEAIEKELAAGGAKGAEAVDVCKTYKRIKPLLETALGLIGAIPIYGGTIAGAIKLLMGIADNTCK